MDSPRLNRRSSLTLHGTTGNTFHIELLHDDKQYRDGNGYQYTTCTELTKVSIDQALIQHIVQTDSNSPLGRNTGIQHQLSIYEIHPGGQEGADNCIYNDGTAHGDNNLPEDRSLTGSIQISGLAQGIRDRIEEALCNQVTQTGTGRIYQDQSEVRIGQVQSLQNEIYCDHGQ